MKEYLVGFLPNGHMDDGNGNELCAGLGDERIVMRTYGPDIELCLRCLGISLGLRPRDATETR